ncbi:WD domain containing protein [Grosmannia clavigera kw1407]|uniref:WD domain containing protein n=1 Tax=Grosmannia clavigera (strain kw1407 / UAMH 11150) TaxID=655863 RepID=F0XM90_GROCL|nr:WD domain containing protein [Grosmannia clavigera kw1407]EFX01031.1 WD domain containing protein [Grosmannia clavigera kw1407]
MQLQNGKERARNSTSSLVPSASPPNASAVGGATSSTYFGHDREEVTRILIQALSDLGYSHAAESVSHHSGFALESQPVSDFRQAVLGGDWAEAEHLLLGAATAGTASSGSGVAANVPGLVLLPDADRSLMRFWIRQQKYLELLEQRETAKALSVLRTELAPLYQDTQKLHFLSSLLMCQSPGDIKKTADWDGAFGQSRQLLLSDLSRFISPSVMLPEHRLAVLLEQVKNYQVSGCVFHTSSTSPSLYADHYCDKSNFPSQVMCELHDGAGDVWQVRFSHDGKRLASCGAGHYVIIWEVPTFKVLLKLDGHVTGVGDISWSPNDTMLVSCGRDNQARIWDTRTGLLLRLFERFDEPVSSCVWATDGLSIVLGSFDKDRALCQWNLAGERLFTWTKKHRTEGLALSPNGQWLVAMDDNKLLHVYNFVTRELEYELELKCRAMSVTISEDSQFMLVNRQDGEIHLYNIALRGTLMRKFVGGTGGDCVIRSAFGGADESFVISGSDDGKLNIWHKNIGVRLFMLDAHKPRCNAVSWSPTDACMFATCGDDKKIKIWSNSERVRQYEMDVARNGVGPRSTGNGYLVDI